MGILQVLLMLWTVALMHVPPARSLQAYPAQVAKYSQNIVRRTFAQVVPVSTTIRVPTSITCTDIVATSLHSDRCTDYAMALESNPRWGGPLIGPIFRYINDFIVGLLGVFVVRILNRFQCIRRPVLLRQIFNREKGRGLITVSNHQSVFDDPGLWGAILPFWRMRPDSIRWSLCADGIFFFNKILTSILGAGNVVPLARFGTLDQPMFRSFKYKVQHGSWCHIFPEGKIFQNWRFDSNEAVLGPFKCGVGKLIAHSYPNVPIVLPMYHSGMQDVIPEKELTDPRARKKRGSVPKGFRTGNKVKVYVGEPIDFTSEVEAFRQRYPGALDSWATTLESIPLYESITRQIRKKVLVLEHEAYPEKQLQVKLLAQTDLQQIDHKLQEHDLTQMKEVVEEKLSYSNHLHNSEPKQQQNRSYGVFG